MNPGLLLSAFIALAFVNASAQSLKLEFARVSAGGGTSSAGSLSLESTVGQLEAGSRLTNGPYSVDTGFLAATLNPSTNAAPVVVLANSSLIVAHQGNSLQFPGFATFSPGPANESAQTLIGYSLSSDSPALFASPPALDSTGTLTFTPTSTASGLVRVTLIAQDNGGNRNGGVDKSTNQFSISLTVGNPNAAPVANPDSYKDDQDDSLVLNSVGGVLANDTDADGNSLTVLLSSTTTHGLLTLNPDGSFLYRPNSNFFGQDSFAYRANDGLAVSLNTATVVIDVRGRPTQILPGSQSLFTLVPLPFSATNSISVTNLDSRFITNQVILTVTNGTIALTTTNGLTFSTAVTNVSRIAMTGSTTNVNAALASLIYFPDPSFSQKDKLSVLTSDDGARTNRDARDVNIFFGISALAGVPLTPTLSSPGKTLTNAALISPDPAFVKGITFDSTNRIATLLTVNAQNGATNRIVIHIIATYSDGSTELVDLPVIFYQPLLSSSLDPAPVFNPNTRLFEQTVTVSNGTPFEVQAFRITATNLPDTVILQNANFFQGGIGYVQYDTKLTPGASVRVTLQYFSADLKPFSPGLRVELLNSPRVVVPPALFEEAPRGIVALNSQAGGKQIYLLFSTVDGTTYYVQYRDLIDSPWITSSSIIEGNGDTIFWLDDGPPNTASRFSPTRFYRVIRSR